MPATQSIVGKPSGYTPSEYPKVVYDKDGKTTLARNPDHLDSLVDAGWSEDYTASAAEVKKVEPVSAPLSKANSQNAEELASAKRAILGLSKDLEKAFDDYGKLNAQYVEALGEIDRLKAAAVPPPAEEVKTEPTATEPPPAPVTKLQVPLAKPNTATATKK